MSSPAVVLIEWIDGSGGQDKNCIGGISNSVTLLSSISMTLVIEGRASGIICMHHKPIKAIFVAISSVALVTSKVSSVPPLDK